ncbi:MAG: hypothetical protein U5R46_18945 [Gammaproteobacteria bacterium]|nr:hypothetical protein [Gammaproteobacteria bacterium]
MRAKLPISLLVGGSLFVGFGLAPAWSQSLSHDLSQGQQPSEQQIEAFCANWGQLSNSQEKQYRAQ